MTEEEKERFAAGFDVQVGVDTGKSFHKLVARRPGDIRSKPLKVTVDRAGFDAAHAHLEALFPDVPPERVLVGIEFAGHHGFTFAHDLARRGYQIVTVLPSATKCLKDVGTNRTRKSDDIDAWQICKLVGQGAYVSYPLLDPIYTSLRLLITARRRLSREEVRFKNRLQGAAGRGVPASAGTGHRPRGWTRLRCNHHLRDRHTIRFPIPSSGARAGRHGPLRPFERHLGQEQIARLQAWPSDAPARALPLGRSLGEPAPRTLSRAV